MKPAAKGDSQRIPDSGFHRDANPLLWLLLITAIFCIIYEARQVSRERQTSQRLTQEIRKLVKDRETWISRKETGFPQDLRLPAPHVQLSGGASAELPMDLPATNLWLRLKDRAHKLNATQVETYLKAYGRHAPNLLAAYRTSGDAAFLKEAVEKYPEHPQVAFEALFAGDVSPEQRREWFAAFLQSAPDNPLPSYLSARDHLQTGETDTAMKELSAAAGKNNYQDYTLSRLQDDEEAYLAAGYTISEAKVAAFSRLGLPHLAQLKELGLQMVEVAKSYRSSGDDNSAQALLHMAVRLGQNYSSEDYGLGQLVGLTISWIGVNAMDPNSAYGNSGYTVGEVSDRLLQEKTELSKLFNQADTLLGTVPDQDCINYIDRAKGFGEEAAIRWLVGKYEQR